MIKTPTWNDTEALDIPTWDNTETADSFPNTSDKAIQKQPKKALEAYRQSLNAFQAGDRAESSRMAQEALRLDPSMVEARRMLERFQINPAAGTGQRASVTEPTAISNKTAMDQSRGIAPQVLDIVKKAVPNLPGVSKPLPSSSSELIDALPGIPGIQNKDIGQDPVTRSLSAGVGQIVASTARIPNLVANIYAFPYNAIVESLGMKDRAVESPRLFEKEAKWWEEKSRQVSAGFNKFGSKGDTLVTVAKRKNPKEIAEYLAYQVLEQAPQLGIMIAATAAGNPGAALSFMGTTSAAQEQSAMDEAVGGSPAMRTANAAINGALEVALEQTPSLMGKWSKVIEESVGKGTKRQVLKNVFKTIASSMIQEGPVEEGGTELAQSLARLATGVDPNAMQGVVERMAEASATGSLLGATGTAPAALAYGLGNATQLSPDVTPPGTPPVLNTELDVAPISSYASGNESNTGNSDDTNVGNPTKYDVVPGGIPDPNTVGDIPTDSSPGVSPTDGIKAPPNGDATPTFEATLPNENDASQGIDKGARGTVEVSSRSVGKNKQKPVKQIEPLVALSSVSSNNKALPIINKTFVVENGVSRSTDLTVALELSSDLPNGVYKVIGKNVEKTDFATNDFPAVTNIQTQKIGTVSRDDLIKNLNRVNKATSKDATRHILNSVNLDSKDGKVKLVSTDGRRLSLSPLDTAVLPNGSYVLPNTPVFSKALSALSGDTFEISVDAKDKSIIEFKGDNGRVVTRLVDGAFPNYEQAIPEPNEQIEIKKSDFDDAIKELTPYAKEAKRTGSWSAIVIYRTGNDTSNVSLMVPNEKGGALKSVTVRATTTKGPFAKMAAGSLMMPIQHEKQIVGPGDSIIATVNPQYLKDAVDSINGDNVYIGNMGENDLPISFRGSPFPKKAKGRPAPKNKKLSPSTKLGNASAGGERIDKFEEAKGKDRIDDFEKLTPTEKSVAFRMSDRVRSLIKKYAGSVGENYLPRGAEGVFYKQSHNIRLKSINDVAVATHEITHAIDEKEGTTTSIIAAKNRELIEALSAVYLEHYPNANAKHPLKRRVAEGLAMLIQKTAEIPTAMREKHGKTLDILTSPGGKFYNKKYADLLKDVNDIVVDFQGLDKNAQVGAFVTGKFQQREARESFLSVFDRIRTVVADAAWPIEKVSIISGVERTVNDPSLWVRASQQISGIIEGNLVGSRGFWIPLRNGDLRNISSVNIGDLVEQLRKDGKLERFPNWLIARDQYFNWARTDELENALKMSEVEIEKEKVGSLAYNKLLKLQQDVKKERDELIGRLEREPLSRETWEEAYRQGEVEFLHYAEIFDAFTRADLSIIEEANLKTPEEINELRSRKGYAPLKRDMYDDVIGAEEAVLPERRVGKAKVSSMIGRKGSSKTYINPLYSIVRDHAEVLRKAMRQMVYNKLLKLAPEMPDVFQQIGLVAIPDKNGRIVFPQERDPNIIMARDGIGKRVPLLVGKEIKNVIDDVLGYRDLNLLEIMLRKTARMFSQMTTGAYPFFVLTNLQIDLITATANSRTKMIPLWDALREFTKAIQNRQGPEAKYAREWLASHGERQSLAGWQDKDPDEFFRLISHEKTWIERATNSIYGGVDFLSAPGKYSEIMSRMTEYIRSRKAGNPWIVAMEDSSRVTTPFQHMGSWGKGTAGKTLIKSIPFLNPQIQVLDQFIRSLGVKENQKRILFVMTAITVASVMGMLSVLIGGTEEQKDQYRDLEGDQLTNYVWLPSTDKKGLLRLRVDGLYGWLAAMVNMAIAEVLFGENYKFRDYADASLAWAPDQFDISNPVRALLSWVPQMVKPTAEVVVDKRTFPSLRPLTPMSLKNKEPRYRSIETTSKFARKLGDKLNVSPIVIDHLIEGYFGRTARFITFRFHNMRANPFTQDWYFTSGRNLQDFYDIKQRSIELVKTLKMRDRELTTVELNEIRNNIPIIRAIDKKLDALRARENELRKSGVKGGLYELRKSILTDIARLRG